MSITSDVIDDYLDTSTHTSEEYENYDPGMDDETLLNMLVKSLEANIEHWQKRPWALEDTDKRNIAYLLGEPLEESLTIKIDGDEFTNNRLFTSVRAILSYATGQLAQPEIGPSSSDDVDKRLARGMQMSLYEHSLDEDADIKFRISLLNLVTRKRAFLKLRYDPLAGKHGDIATEICNPEDIVIDRFAKFNEDPNIIYHRVRCTVDELVALFPKKTQQIYRHFNIQRGVYTQMSRMITYYEAWFTYMKQDVRQQGVAWFLPESDIILDKMKNPNWVYDDVSEDGIDKNVMNEPPKPFVPFNYFNLGRSYIDETCLFDQAVPLQKLINKRIKQITDNADYVNGRWVMSKKSVDEADAKAFINKGTNTTLMTDADDVGKAVVNISSNQLPAYVYQSLIDARNELDTIMGTPSQFRGEGSESQNTLGKDQMIKNQAGMLQDDLVRAVNNASKHYYKLKLQMMAVYYTQDYTYSQKGSDGSYNFFVLNGDNIDRNVKVGVRIDSTLPLDKQSIRNTAMGLAKMNRIDNLSLFEDLGVPDPEIRAERLARQTLDPMGYMNSMQTNNDNTDAELDIMLVTAGKTPDERSVYDEAYLTYWNNFMTTNRFAMMPPDAKQRIVMFLQFVQQKAQQMQQLQSTQSTPDDAGMIPFVAAPIVPQVKLTGALSQGDSEQMARVDPTKNPQEPPGNTVNQNANGSVKLTQPDQQVNNQL